MNVDFNQIETVIFDFGGVLLNIDYQRTVEEFRKLGLANPQDAFTKEVQAEIFQKYETGEISESVFLSELAQRIPHTTHEQLSAAWCAILGNLPLHRFRFLEALSKSHRLFILSNTNYTHQVVFEKTIDETYGWENFRNLFDEIVYSHEIGLRKPHREVFDAVIQQFGIDPKSTLFIDDSPQHLVGASKAGLQTIHLKDGEDVTEVLSELLRRNRLTS